MSQAPSEIEIVNAAFDLISVANIGSFQDNTKQAKKAKFWYPLCRDSLIQESYWTFADTEIFLSPVTYTWPSNNYQYTYLYPTDCLKIKSICTQALSSDLGATNMPIQNNRFDYNTDGVTDQIRELMDANGLPTGQKAILCDLQNAVLIYVRQITNTALFPPLFTQTLIHQLAQRMAKIFNSDLSIKKDVDADLENVESKAKKASANEENELDLEEGSYVRSRKAGIYY